ncbi:MAG: FHA domain-containing protein [Prevotella sp.]|nr:FHA domain-containing protein [Prevotella sp.]
MEEQETIMTCVCPHCKATIRIKSPAKSGRYKYTCTKCGKPFAVAFDGEKQEQHDSEPDTHVTRKLEDRDRYRTIGGLVERRQGLFGKNKVWPLAEGKQTIGRESVNSPSDIMFNDVCMSRQSVELNVERHQDTTGQCFVYVLTVKRQKNPILHNNEPLSDGEEIILHIGDTITLGQTVLTLK